MKIRSLTCFFNPKHSNPAQILPEFVRFVHKASSLFEAAGYRVQTKRLATTPFPQLLQELTEKKAVSLARQMETAAREHGFEFLSLGPADPNSLSAYRLIPAMLTATEISFFSGIMADGQNGINLPAVRACAEIIHQAAPITPDGFANLRFTALGNVPAFVPFFPAAYHQGEVPAFALAIECADVVVSAFQHAGSLQQARDNLINTLNQHAKKLAQITESLSREFQLDFKGFDFSPAPFPSEDCSLGKGIELLGPPRIGSLGSVSAAAFVAEALDRGSWQRSGFNGLMLPVLEDATLAQRSIDGSLTLKDLLLFSTVCGTGLDTVPLPGSATPQQLAAVLLDVAVLSVRLAKPLTARLMPIPGKQAGDSTNFNFDYFKNGQVLDLPAFSLDGLFNGDETFLLNPRWTY